MNRIEFTNQKALCFAFATPVSSRTSKKLRMSYTMALRHCRAHIHLRKRKEKENGEKQGAGKRDREREREREREAKRENDIVKDKDRYSLARLLGARKIS